MRLVLVTGLVLVMVLLRRAPSRLVSMTGCRAGPEAEAASRQLLDSRQQTRLHAWRRMAYTSEKRNVKREMSKERGNMVKEGDSRRKKATPDTRQTTTLTPSQLPKPLSPQTTSFTAFQLGFNVSASILACRTICRMRTMMPSVCPHIQHLLQ